MIEKKLYFKDSLRKNLNIYIDCIWSILPQIEKPNILDLGCGSGEPAIKLAEISGGTITCVDNNVEALEWFKKKINNSCYENRIKILKNSVFDLNFNDFKFDIIWAEGIFNVIGFEKGLSISNKHLKPNGFLVIHDELLDEDNKFKISSDIFFRILKRIKIPSNVWWKKYYSPMEEYIQKSDNETIKTIFLDDWIEIEHFKRNPNSFESVYYIFQKII